MEKKPTLPTSSRGLAKRLGVVLAVVVGAVLTGGAAAQALPGGAFYSVGGPQYVMNGSIRAGEMYGEYYGYRDHPTYGSGMEWQTWYRQPNSDNENGAYVWTQSYYNGTNCYTTSFSTPGVNCTGQWITSATLESPRRKSSSYTGYFFFWYLNASGTSHREGSKICSDVSWATDPCAGFVYRGSDY
ncbi:hypothetical protein AB0B31_28255 [Catellatospora citrea]|uniref:hypothetical protein n=1 Tax=Catellatospora citrea TaxID=53366 RepID=UPI0033FBF4D3